MRTSTLASLGALTALLLPATESTPLANASFQDPAATRQDPKRDPTVALADATAQLAEANRQIAAIVIERDKLREERKPLLEAQAALSRSRNLGSPMEREAMLRSPVDSFLAAQERALATQPPQDTIDLYSATIRAVFSPVTCDKDARLLAEALTKLGLQDGTAVKSACDQFRKDMAAWGKMLETPESIRRLVAQQGKGVATIAMPDATALFLAAPCDENVQALVAIAIEYKIAKTLFLGSIMREHGLPKD